MVDFLSRIESFIKNNAMTATEFGIEVLGDPGFVFALRDPENPRKPRKHTVEWVNLWLDTAASGKRIAASDRYVFTPPRGKKAESCV
jgi:hypothetical protein